jgi:pyruvate/2-oxoglutarate/acetoin dehydrogenase E1 component
VVCLEHRWSYGQKGEVPEEFYTVPIGSARVARPGRDVTVVAVSQMVDESLKAAETLAKQGIEAEVLDLRTLRPLDRAAIVAALGRTNRLAVVEEGPVSGGWGGEVLAVAVEEALHDVDDVWRIATADHPIPYSPTLEDAFLPGPEAIAASVRARLGRS